MGGFGMADSRQARCLKAHHAELTTKTNSRTALRAASRHRKIPYPSAPAWPHRAAQLPSL
jgi:hypothetical protein